MLHSNGCCCCRLHVTIVTDVQSLEARRLKADLVYVNKIVFNLVDTDSNQFFSVKGNNSGTSGHTYKTYIDYCRINTRNYFC